MHFVIDPSCLGTMLCVIASTFSGGMSCEDVCSKKAGEEEAALSFCTYNLLSIYGD